MNASTPHTRLATGILPLKVIVEVNALTVVHVREIVLCLGVARVGGQLEFGFRLYWVLVDADAHEEHVAEAGARRCVALKRKTRRNYQYQQKPRNRKVMRFCDVVKLIRFGRHVSANFTALKWP